MIKQIFAENDIEFFGALPFEHCRVIFPELLERRGINAESIKTAIPFLVPYYVGGESHGGISVYARARDYHIYFDGLYKTVVPRLEAHYGKNFYGFSDKSAIDEVRAASCAGLGMIGDNFLIINEKYGSFVFIGELLTDATAEELGFEKKSEYTPSECAHCGACRRECPMMREGRECISTLTQRKGELSAEEEAYLLRYGYSWGCDICSLACPFTKKAVASGIGTPIKFFNEDRIQNITADEAEKMEKEKFLLRAFSWRGKKTIVRNLKIFEEMGNKR